MQAANFLRSLRQTSEAVALGLLEGVKGERGAVDIAVEAQKDKSVVRRIERLSRFLLSRFDKEEKIDSNEDSGTIQSIFGLVQNQITTCLTQERPPKEQLTSTFQIELRYTEAGSKDDHSTMQFSDVLSRSLRSSSEMRAWFDDEVRYQMVKQERVPIKMPNVLVAYTGLEDRSLLRFWKTKEEDEENTKCRMPFAVSVAYGSAHESLSVTTADSIEDIGHLLDGVEHQRSKVEIYVLTSVISYIYDQDEAAEIGNSYEGHLLAHIKVPEAYRRSMDSTNMSEGFPDTGSQWMTFNDFSINESNEKEVSETFDGQKIPILLYFTKFSYIDKMKGKQLVEPRPVLSPDQFLQLLRSPPIQVCVETNIIQLLIVFHCINCISLIEIMLQRNKQGCLPENFIPLTEEELPGPGKLFALDAEFVAYSAPEKRVLSEQDDAARTSRLGLGRVSVVRGDGPRAGVTCIDDYIKSVEPVYDHLTRYSGLVPGDLDPERSSRHLTTLKKSYLKLRYMVDSGCLFVGHGLKKDFRMLNIVVPSNQIIDTVDLYHSGRGRRLSLKFLSSYFLGDAIQGSTHDSVEDATAALKLYQLHQDLTEKNAFQSALKKAYEWGAANGWDPSNWNQKPPPFINHPDS